MFLGTFCWKSEWLEVEPIRAFLKVDGYKGSREVSRILFAFGEETDLQIYIAVVLYSHKSRWIQRYDKLIQLLNPIQA